VKVLNELISYFDKTLGVEVEIEQRAVLNNLPYFITDHYRLYKAKLLNRCFVLMIDKFVQHSSPDVIRKHVEKVSDKTGLSVIYVVSALTSFNRKRLINYRTNFVVPNNQMYLPHLMIDLREHYRSREQEKDYLTPSSQAILIYSLLHSNRELYSSSISKELKYSETTVSRSFREISGFGIGDIVKDIRENILNLPREKRELWNKAYPLMRSPVMKEVWVNSYDILKELPLAGLSALSEYTMIAPLRNEVFAISSAQWNQAVKEKTVKQSIEPEATDYNKKIEIWHYTAKLVKFSNIVDKYSLYLSLKQDPDERIQHALQYMLEEELNG
jgi:AraC-like DNA-binding protein